MASYLTTQYIHRVFVQLCRLCPGLIIAVFLNFGARQGNRELPLPTEAPLYGTPLYGMRTLRKRILRNALYGTSYYGMTILRNLTLRNAHLTETHFTEAHVTEPHFTECACYGTSLYGMRILRNLTLRKRILRNLTLRNLTLRKRIKKKPQDKIQWAKYTQYKRANRQRWRHIGINTKGHQPSLHIAPITSLFQLL